MLNNPANLLTFIGLLTWGSRVYPNGQGSWAHPGQGRRCAWALPSWLALLTQPQIHHRPPCHPQLWHGDPHQEARYRICWLPNQQISITGNAPYSTSIGIHTSIVRCPSWYYPFFLSIIIFHLATSLHYVCLMSPKRFNYFPQYIIRYGN
jgi:hypothetical protein